MNASAAARALAVALVPHLPRGWRAEFPADPDWYWAELVRDADDARVRVSVGGYRLDGRVTFRGGWPKFRDGTEYYGRAVHGPQGTSVSITCRATRPPKAIAREFARRFLPIFDAEYAAARAYVRERDRQSEEAEAVAHRIADAVDAEVYDNQIRRGDGVHLRSDDVHRLVVRPAYRGIESRPVRVSFEVHNLDPETAVEVLTLIRTARERPELERARVAAAQEYDDEPEAVDLAFGEEDAVDALLSLPRRIHERV